MTHINRRRALAVVAAVPAAAALAAVPAVAAKVALANAISEEDAGLLEYGEQCKALALETRRLHKILERAAERREKAFYEMKPERWRCDRGAQGAGTLATVPGEADAWQVLAVDTAPRWFDTFLDVDCREGPLPSKWIRLKAKSEAEAKGEASVLSRKLDNEFFAKRDQAGVPFARDTHYRNWVKRHSELRRAVKRLAKFKSFTLKGLNMKAMVLAVAHDAFDEPGIWNEPLLPGRRSPRLGVTTGVTGDSMAEEPKRSPALRWQRARQDASTANRYSD